MSSLRQDPLTGRWVVIAAKRQGRPNDFKRADGDTGHRSQDGTTGRTCDFCPGQESQTPDEVLATGRPQDQEANSPGWQVRVFPNKYPAMKANPEPFTESENPLLQPRLNASGGHEVLVCSPEHKEGLADLPVDHLAEIISVVRQRTTDLSVEHSQSRYVLAFGNQGPEAGATLAHSHLQIITLPVVPALVVDKMDHFIQHDAAVGSCLMCDTLASEELTGLRIISSNSHWVALAPWASRFAYEMTLIPRRHEASFQEASDTEIHQLADLLKVCLTRLNDCASSADYNLVFHNAPLASKAGSGYGNERLDAMLETTPHGLGLFHWHVEILPRLSRLAGFEAGTGFAINSLPPEDAAERLRPEGS